MSPGLRPRSAAADGRLARLLDRSVLAGALALAAVAATFVVLYLAHRTNARWVEHSRRVARMGREALILAVDRETGVRGYLLTRDSASLAPDLAARAPLAARLDSLAALTIDNPRQHERALAVRAAVTAWEQAFAAPALRAAAAGAPVGAVGRLAGKGWFDAVRARHAEFLREEDALYKLRQARDERTQLAALAAVLLEIVVILLALAALRRRVVGQAHELAAHQAQLEEQAIELEEQAVELEQQTDEAQALARELESVNGTLRQQYDFLRTVLAATEDRVFAKDLAGRYVVANGATARALGRPEAEILGRSDQELFPAALAAELRASDAEVLATGESVRVEETVVVRGEPRFFQSTKSVYRDAAGEPAGVVGVSADVTDRRRSEERLRQANRELAATTYSIAHDLRSPLRALDGYSRILQLDYATRLDAAGLALLERIRSNSQRMGELIDGILALARIGQGGLQVARVDLSAEARRVVDELRRLHPGRAVEARVQPGVTATGDPRLLTLALQNLLDNAWKFTRGRDPAVIEFGERRDAAGTVYFVRDNGAGFDPAYAPKLFGAFQRLHHASEFEGHGIGLAGVKRVVERHGGRVWADGAEGRGATFYFTLGTSRPATAAPPGGAAPRDGDGSTTP